MISALIVSHWRNYREPVLQRYAIRILLMLPIYCIMSYISLLVPHAAFYLTTIRDVYEAYTLYSFMALMLAAVGGPARLVDLFRETDRSMPKSYLLGTCCLAGCALNGPFLRRTLQGVLQFVVVKLFLVALVVLLQATGAYHEGDLHPRSGYFYCIILVNLSMSTALYSLVVFWAASAPFLKPFRPALKFFYIKGVIFVLFWQTMLLNVVSAAGHIAPFPGHSETDTVIILANFLVCIESVPFALLAIQGFRPSKTYPGWHRVAPPTPWPVGRAILHSLSLTDVLEDTRVSFAPRYVDFVRIDDATGAAAHKELGLERSVTNPTLSLLRTIPAAAHLGLGGAMTHGHDPSYGMEPSAPAYPEVPAAAAAAAERVGVSGPSFSSVASARSTNGSVAAGLGGPGAGAGRDGGVASFHAITNSNPYGLNLAGAAAQAPGASGLFRSNTMAPSGGSRGPGAAVPVQQGSVPPTAAHAGLLRLQRAESARTARDPQRSTSGIRGLVGGLGGMGKGGARGKAAAPVPAPPLLRPPPPNPSLSLRLVVPRVLSAKEGLEEEERQRLLRVSESGGSPPSM